MKRGTLLCRVQRIAAASLVAAAWQAGAGITAAAADSLPPGGAPPPGAPAPLAAPPPPAAPAAPAPAPAPLAAPAMAGPLTANPAPLKFDAGPLGTIYGSGMLTGLGLVQSNSILGDRNSQFDISNGQAVVQKTDGIVQFYTQAGIYSLPTVGYSYLRATDTNSATFGPLPVGYLKLAPTDSFSIMAGKLPTLIGAEYTFTFENMNIERGLLWNQEPAISRGVQANYATGPFSFSAAYNDGYYSDRFNWLVGLASYTINSANSVSVVGGGNVGRSTPGPVAPTAQNNGGIFNLIYTYNAAPWTITPYFQYSHVSKDLSIGIGHEASTYGGAVLVNYAFNDNFNLSGRAEVIGSTGSVANGAPDLLFYGPGSTAWSLTATPTYQVGRFFVRAEGSIVGISSIVAGEGFGHSGTAKTQARLVLETGFLF